MSVGRDDIEPREHVMLYDPKWEKQFVREETETERELKSLISWLEKQPASSSYPWTDIGNCLLGRYFTARYGLFRGRQMSAFAGMAEVNSPTHTLLMKVAYPDPHTYGAALKRALAGRAIHEE
jgi:hypothetical protein